MIEISVVTFLMMAIPAYAQDSQSLKTIADCPKGTALAVQDSANPQPFIKAPPADSSFDGQQKWQAEQANQLTQAPRQFVTGCVSKTIQQSR